MLSLHPQIPATYHPCIPHSILGCPWLNITLIPWSPQPSITPINLYPGLLPMHPI